MKQRAHRHGVNSCKTLTDRGGSEIAMQRLNEARDRALREVMGG